MKETFELIYPDRKPSAVRVELSVVQLDALLSALEGRGQCVGGWNVLRDAQRAVREA